MSHQRQDYLAYLLRLWRADTKQGPVWRASLDSPHTGERQGFADLAALFAFLEDQALQATMEEGKER